MKRRHPPRPTRPLGRLGSHVTKQGAPKSAYRTETEARGAAQLAWTLNRAELTAYRCEVCHQWHVGGRGRGD